jgi:hypothetical protein
MTKVSSERLLPRNARIRKAAKIIDKNRGQKVGRCTDSIANMLDWQDWRCTNMEVLRRTDSKDAKKVAAWLNNGVRLFDALHCWPSGFENFRQDVKRWARRYEDEKNQRASWRRLKPKRTAGEKLVATEAALHLCDEFAINPTTTKDGAFCKLAAVMLGDEKADLQKYCSEVLEPGYRTFLARQGAESRPKKARVRR